MDIEALEKKVGLMKEIQGLCLKSLDIFDVPDIVGILECVKMTLMHNSFRTAEEMQGDDE